ncbi:MAG: hypothetical protein WA432_00875 [Candidatus Babeliaceae bacterium]
MNKVGTQLSNKLKCAWNDVKIYYTKTRPALLKQINAAKADKRAAKKTGIEERFNEQRRQCFEGYAQTNLWKSEDLYGDVSKEDAPAKKEQRSDYFADLGVKP